MCCYALRDSVDIDFFTDNTEPVRFEISRFDVVERVFR